MTVQAIDFHPIIRNRYLRPLQRKGGGTAVLALRPAQKIEIGKDQQVISEDTAQQSAAGYRRMNSPVSGFGFMKGIPVLHRSHPVVFPENFAEVAAGKEAGLFRDFQNRTVASTTAANSSSSCQCSGSVW